MEVGLIRSVDIDQEMQQAYLDYAMSVIVARALPDARDGLKPVHRRILYAMYDMGIRPDTPHKKSARIVGEVLGKYHPHGDMAVYEAMARMAQDFSMRYMLVDGQGNFGSVDGDPPAAMRYTEARLAAPAMHLLADIQKNTVNFTENFDGSLTEPDVLPAAIPNLLVNGATGIAVGMSTSIPPHNLGEVVDALIYMLNHWEALDDTNVENLMRFIQGPDFPTGGIIVEGQEEDGLLSAYGSGRGKVTVQARAHVEEMSHGRNRIIVTELPYMTNKASLIERMAELVRDGRLEGLADLRDESDRHGLRIVIELTKTAVPETVLQDLYRLTPMRSTFGIIMLALVDGEPRMLSLKQALRVYLDHRLLVIRRRGEFELERARQRAHILEGLRVALKHLDEVIDLIRKAPDADIARTRLMKRFRLSQIQAQAILDMQLRRLAALERKKIEDEYKEVIALIKGLEGLLRSPRKIRQVAADELQVVKDAYGDRRRTQIVYVGKKGVKEAPLLAAELTPQREVWIAVTGEGLISRTLDETQPASSGREAPAFLAKVNTRDTLFLVSENGEAAGLPVHAVPEVESPSQGAQLYKVSGLAEQDRLAALFTLSPKEERREDEYVLTATRQGLIKKTAASELPGPTAKTFTLMKVNEGDRFGWVRLTDGKADVLLATADGMAIRFSEEDVRPMGLVAAGVGGIKLGGMDSLIGMELVPSGGEILLVSSDGKAKRVSEGQFPRQGRYGQGVVAWKLPRTSTLVGTATGRATTRLTLHLEKLAPKALRFDETPVQTRAAQGKRIVDVKSGDRVASLTMPWEAAGAGAAEAPRRRGGGTERTTEKRRRRAAPRKAVKKAIGEVKEKAERKEKPAVRKRSGRPAAKPKPRQAGTSTRAKRGGKKTTSEKPPAVRKRLGAAVEQLSFGIVEEKSTGVKKTPAKKPVVKKVPAQKPAKSKGAAEKTGKATGTGRKKKRASRPHARLAGKGRLGQV